MPFEQELVALGIEVPAEEEAMEVITRGDIEDHVGAMGDMLSKLTESDFIFMLKLLTEQYEGLE